MKKLYDIVTSVVLATILVAPLPAPAQHGPGGPGEFQLKFVSQPPQVCRVGAPYLYTARARSMDSMAVIRYYSDPINPVGFRIDSLTGVVNWTPAVRGWYQIGILARSNRGEVGAQRFAVTVSSGNGVVQGKVTDTLGVGIPQVVVEVLQASNAGPAGCYSFATKTDPYGNYRIANIDTGWYKLHAVSPTPQYASLWYDGKATAGEANRIYIPDSPSVTIANFSLRSGTGQLPLLTVKGSVTDTADVPLPGAQVVFVRAGFALNSNGTVEDFRRMFDMAGPGLDFRLEGFSPHVFRTRADSTGNYALRVPPGPYVAYARAPGYATEFYLEQPNLLSATRIPLKNDTTGIDFTLAPLPPVVYGTIAGSVLDSAKGVGVRARIIAMRDRWLSADLYGKPRSYTVDTDSLGAYRIDHLVPGSYVVLALPVGSYAPAFYTGDTMSTSWRRATRVQVDGNVIEGIDIYVHEIPVEMRGYASIAGQVRLSAASSAGTFVYAMRNARVAGYAIAGEGGGYAINGLAPGTYTVTADLAGTDVLQSKSASLSYTSTGTPVGAIVDLELSSVTAVGGPEGTTPETFALLQNYPNPFNPATTIGYRLASTGHVELRVFDLLGREVALLVNGVQTPGAYQVTFGTSGLASGVYLYRLSAGTATMTRKMLLMK